MELEAVEQHVIELRSDTFTKPSKGMYEAMCKAPVGDSIYDEDPTIALLEKTTAELFGKEAALFMPSGTMANLVASMFH
jgi:threonine aldolase